MSRFRKPKTPEEEKINLDASTPTSTTYTTKWGVKIFEEWQAERANADPAKEESSMQFNDRNTIQNLHCTKLEDMNFSSLNFWLIKFVQEMAKKNGERYPPKTMYFILCSLNRYISEKNQGDAINILDKQEKRLVQFRRCLDAEMKQGTREGIAVKCKKPEREEITVEEEEILWTKELLGGQTSESLLHTIYFYNGKLFGLRAKEHRQIRLLNFRIDDNCIIFDESLSKTFHGGLSDLKYKPRVVKHFCHKEGSSEHARCLLKLYSMYFSKIEVFAKGIEAFYFRPRKNKESFGYDKVPVGIHALNKILPEKLCVRAGLKRKTAHCLRISCASNLFQNNIEEKLIRQRTGHRSDALMQYERPTRAQLEEASSFLSPPIRKSDADNLWNDLPSFSLDFPDFCQEGVDEFKCDVSDLELGDIDLDAFEAVDYDVSGADLSTINLDKFVNVGSEVKENSTSSSNTNSNNSPRAAISNPVFSNCSINFTFNIS